MTTKHVKLVAGGRSYLVDTEAQELFKEHEERIRLTRQQWNLLHYFMASRGKLVTPGDLIAQVWGGREPTPEAISQAIKTLREALGDKGSQSFIQTVRNRGYRFLAEISELNETLTEDDLDRPLPKKATGQPSRKAEPSDTAGSYERRELGPWPLFAEKFIEAFDKRIRRGAGWAHCPRSTWHDERYEFDIGDEEWVGPIYCWGEFWLLVENSEHVLKFRPYTSQSSEAAVTPWLAVLAPVSGPTVKFQWLDKPDMKTELLIVSDAVERLYQALWATFDARWRERERALKI